MANVLEQLENEIRRGQENERLLTERQQQSEETERLLTENIELLTERQQILRRRNQDISSVLHEIEETQLELIEVQRQIRNTLRLRSENLSIITELINAYNYMNQRDDEQLEQAPELQRRLRAGEVPAEELFQQFHEDLPVDRPTPHNPNPIEIVNNQEIVSKPITSDVWPGRCQICLTSNQENLCRVNCTKGHIFHCDCLNEWRDTYTRFGWNDKCPSCREPINQAVHVPDNIDLPTEFGKRKRSNHRLLRRMSVAHSFNGTLLKQIDRDIKYLSK